MAVDEATSIASVEDRRGQMSDSEAVPTGDGSAVAAGAKERRGHMMTIKGIQREVRKMEEGKQKGRVGA